MPTPLPPSGDIREFDLIQIFKDLHGQKVTGSLIFRNREAMKCIYLRQGDIVFAASNISTDRLGEVLFRKGKIDSQQLEYSVKRLQKNGKKLGAILVEEGFITAKELFDGLKDQVKEIIYGLTLWEEGEYLFVEQDLPEKAIPLQLDITHLISEILNETLKKVQA
jgi:hypothetical protein